MMPASSIDALIVAMVEAAQRPTLAEAALAYANAGVHIFPTQPGDKTPLPGSHGHLDATTDLAKVTEWWTRHPQANIACSPGRSGLLVVDIDGPNRKEEDGTLKLVADGRKTWERLRREAGDTAPYFQTRSPGKGKGSHAWYRYPAGRRIGSPKVTDAPGLQVYGVLGYVMLPPSVHPDGPRYTFDTSSYRVSDVPAWLLGRIPETGTSEAPTATDEQTSEFLSARSGHGLDGFWRLAIEHEADQVREAELRHPMLLSAIARAVGWSSEHPDEFDLDAGLELLLHALEDALAGEDRNFRKEFRGALNWVVGHELAHLEEVRQAEEAARYGDWPELKPLKPPASGSVALHHLPPTIRAVVDTVAEHTQTPPEHAMLAALSTMSAATVGKACVDMTWREPGALWTISVAPPSDRKSAVTELVASTPLTEAMAAVSEGLAGDVREAEARTKAATARLATIEKNMAKDNPSASLRDWADTKAELDEIEQPVLPAFLISDATPEAVEIVMAEQRGAAAVVSAEGALISSIGGRYTEKQKARVGPLNSAFSAEAIHTRRVKGGRSIPRPHLSMTLIVQPTVLMEMGGTESFVESGFFARFLYSLPDSRVGRRGSDTPPLDESAVARWSETVGAVLTRFWARDQPAVLPMGTGGRETIKRLRGEVERLLDQSSTSPAEHYWLGKVVGQVGRIALMFTLSEDPGAVVVPDDHVQRAAGMFPYLWRQARIAFGQSVEMEGGNLEFAKAIMRWVARRELSEFSSRDLGRLGPGRWRGASDDERDATLGLLSDHGYLREMPSPASSPRGGRPPSTRWSVSPRVALGDCATPLDDCAGAPEPCADDAGCVEMVSEQVSGPIAQSPVQSSEEPSEAGHEVSSQTRNFTNISNESTTTTLYGLVDPPAHPSLFKEAAQNRKTSPDPAEVDQENDLVAPPATSDTKLPPDGSGSWDEYCNPNLYRKPINAYVADRLPRLHPDGSCSRCGSIAVERCNGLVLCQDCGTSFTALVVSGD